MCETTCNCGNCFFNKYSESICQRFPPVYVVYMGGIGEWRQPDITNDGYCGEWKTIC